MRTRQPQPTNSPVGDAGLLPRCSQGGAWSVSCGKSLPRKYVNMQHIIYIFATAMRVYLQSDQLGVAIAKALTKMGKTQKSAAKDLDITQGAISNLLAGRFGTKNDLVTKVCKYRSQQVSNTPSPIRRGESRSRCRACPRLRRTKAEDSCSYSRFAGLGNARPHFLIESVTSYANSAFGLPSDSRRSK